MWLPLRHRYDFPFCICMIKKPLIDSDRGGWLVCRRSWFPFQQVQLLLAEAKVPHALQHAPPVSQLPFLLTVIPCGIHQLWDGRVRAAVDHMHGHWSVITAAARKTPGGAFHQGVVMALVTVTIADPYLPALHCFDQDNLGRLGVFLVTCLDLCAVLVHLIVPFQCQLLQ